MTLNQLSGLTRAKLQFLPALLTYLTDDFFGNSCANSVGFKLHWNASNESALWANHDFQNAVSTRTEQIIGLDNLIE
jgi:hypothetical protein